MKELLHGSIRGDQKKKVCWQVYYVLMVSRDRMGKVRAVKYLPEGVPLKVGHPKHKPDVVITTDESFTNPVVVKRDREDVYIHLPNQVIHLQPGQSLNLTSVVLQFHPVFSYVPTIEEIWQMEQKIFDPSTSERLRRFYRIYSSLMALKIMDGVPRTVRDSLVLFISRMTGIPVEKVVSEKKILEKSLEAQVKEMLESMSSSELLSAFESLIG
jgi:hypothetical protein